jgi:hypothetical protein
VKFKHYLLGTEFIIRTDHKALIWMLNWNKPNSSQYCRWIAELELFNFTIEYRPGINHGNADAMSRNIGCEQCDLIHEYPKKRRNVKVLKCLVDDDNTVPKDKELLVSSYHKTLGHIGISKLLEVLKEDGHEWSGISHDVKMVVNDCMSCAERKRAVQKKNPMTITASRPFEKVMIDITGPLTPKSQ